MLAVTTTFVDPAYTVVRHGVGCSEGMRREEAASADLVQHT